MQYRTPFVGLFLAPDCYLRLLSNLRGYLGRPLNFLSQSRHEYVNEFRERNRLTYPIGFLEDEIEVQFLHYASPHVATDKWFRRIERMVASDERLFVKFCDRDGCTQEQLAAFDQLPYQHKVCFVSKPAPDLQSAVCIPSSDDGCVPDGLRLSRISPRYFDAAGWINGNGGTRDGGGCCVVRESASSCGSETPPHPGPLPGGEGEIPRALRQAVHFWS